MGVRSVVTWKAHTLLYFSLCMCVCLVWFNMVCEVSLSMHTGISISVSVLSTRSHKKNLTKRTNSCSPSEDLMCIHQNNTCYKYSVLWVALFFLIWTFCSGTSLVPLDPSFPPLFEEALSNAKKTSWEITILSLLFTVIHEVLYLCISNEVLFQPDDRQRWRPR